MVIFKGLLLFLAVVLLNCITLCANASTLLDPSAPYPTLCAARPILDVLPRSDGKIPLTNAAELVYVHDNVSSDEPTFASHIKVHSLAPILVLEDLDGQLDEVSCTDGDIKIHFLNADDFETAKLNLHSLIGGHIITSHSGCSDEGARTPFLVDSLAFSYTDTYVTFRVIEASWMESFNRVDMEFSYTDQPHELLKHSRLRRDFAAVKHTKTPEHDTQVFKPSQSADSFSESGDASSTPTSSESASSTSRFVIPDMSIIPTSTDLPDSITIDLNKEVWQDELSLKAAAEEVIPWASHSPMDITVECLDCHTRGSLVLSQGNWSFPTLKSLQNNNTKLINNGSIDIDLQDFSTHIELRLTPSLSGSLSYELFTIPIPAADFVIPGLGRAGLIFKPELYFDWATTSTLALTYGFDLALPAPARLHVDFANASASSLSGLSAAAVRPLAFNANASTLALSLALGLRAHVVVAFAALGALTAEAGAYVDVPALAVDARMVPAANVSAATCAAERGRGAADGGFAEAFPELLAVGAEVSVAAGVDVVVTAPPMPWVEPCVARWSPEAVGAAEGLAARCLAFANASVGFVDAAAVEVEVAGQERAREKEREKHRNGASARSPSPVVLVTAAVGGLVAVAVLFCCL